jgi:hypothetical protein
MLDALAMLGGLLCGLLLTDAELLAYLKGVCRG